MLGADHLNLRGWGGYVVLSTKPEILFNTKLNNLFDMMKRYFLLFQNLPTFFLKRLDHMIFAFSGKDIFV